MNDPHAADYCPTCGLPHECISDIVRHGLALRGHTLTFKDKRVRLRPGVAKLARALMERGQASHELLRLRIAPESDSNLVHVYAVYLRRHLAELTAGAIILRTIHSWGYEISASDEVRVAA